MIEKLTPEQEAAMPKYVDRWLKIGLGTGPNDIKNSIIAAKKSYEAAKLVAPTFFGLACSPLSGAVANGIEGCMEDLKKGKTKAEWKVMEGRISERVTKMCADMNRNKVLDESQQQRLVDSTMRVLTAMFATIGNR